MKFEEKIIAILKYLKSADQRKGELSSILDNLNIEFIDNDLSEFRKYFRNSEFVSYVDMAKRRMILTLNQIGLDYVNSYHVIKERKKEEQEYKKMQYEELKQKVQGIEKQLKERSEFWTSSTDRNKDQITYFWISIGLSILSLLIAIFK